MFHLFQNDFQTADNACISIKEVLQNVGVLQRHNHHSLQFSPFSFFKYKKLVIFRHFYTANVNGYFFSVSFLQVLT